MTPRKTLLSTFTSAVLVFAAGATQVAMAESVPFVGNVNLCAVDMSGVTIEEMGEGLRIERNWVYAYRFDTDHPAFTGWDVMTFDSKFVRDIRQYTTGEHYLTPDDYAVGAIREEMIDLLIEDEPISGTMVGMGSLDGVSVEYTTTLNMGNAEYCYNHPYCDDPGANCTYLDELSPPIGYDLEGIVNTPE